ncbi:MAG: protease inhibitor I42 family protein [Nitrospirae bacterium]|nr:protease inhibitor I42 family protein [Nitrospirota bacterium]
MNKRTVLSIAVVVVFLIFNIESSGGGSTGGGSVGGVTTPDKSMTITKKDNGGKISTNPGSVIYIELQETGSTGYAWYFDNLDMEYFEAIKDKSVKILSNAVKPGKMITGAPAIATWALKVKKKGQAALKLRCYRIWEGPQSAVDTFSVQVEIE